MPEASQSLRRYRNGFSLVEILIVVIILGILAAIVIPRFQTYSADAKAGNTMTQLKQIRDQLERYRIQHDFEYPDLVGDGWDAMTGRTDFDHTLNAAGNYGPYLTGVPVNPFTESSGIAGTEVAGNGWYYDLNTGDFYAVGFDETTLTYTAP